MGDLNNSPPPSSGDEYDVLDDVINDSSGDVTIFDSEDYQIYEEELYADDEFITDEDFDKYLTVEDTSDVQQLSSSNSEFSKNLRPELSKEPLWLPPVYTHETEKQQPADILEINDEVLFTKEEEPWIPQKRNKKNWSDNTWVDNDTNNSSTNSLVSGNKKEQVIKTMSGGSRLVQENPEASTFDVVKKVSVVFAVLSPLLVVFFVLYTTLESKL